MLYWKKMNIWFLFVSHSRCCTPSPPSNLGLNSPSPLSHSQPLITLWLPFSVLKPLHLQHIFCEMRSEVHTVLDVRARLNLHSGVIMSSVQFSRLPLLMSNIWFAFLTSTKHRYAFIKLSKRASGSCSWTVMLTSQPITNTCEALPSVYHFMLKFVH